jgi:hypothetical protein
MSSVISDPDFDHQCFWTNLQFPQGKFHYLSGQVLDANEVETALGDIPLSKVRSFPRPLPDFGDFTPRNFKHSSLKHILYTCFSLLLFLDTGPGRKGPR